MSADNIRGRNARSRNQLSTSSSLSAKVSYTTYGDSSDLKDAIAEARWPPDLLTYDQIPKWRQDNHFVTGGYRPTTNSYTGSFASLGYLHNEFVNIYTHALGAISYPIAGIALYYMLRDRYASSSIGDVIACGCFFLGALLCLGMSAIYHTITNHSPLVSRFGNALDYIGIVCLIAGSFVPAVYYGFYCDPHLQIAYWTMEVIIGVGCAIVSVKEEFRTPKWRPFRASMFVGMGLSSVVAVLHGCVKYGAGPFMQQIRYDWMIFEGIQYIAGAALYALRFPERLSPGTFNIWGSSHQIFHCLVLTAAATHLVGIVKSFDLNHQHASCLG